MQLSLSIIFIIIWVIIISIISIIICNIIIQTINPIKDKKSPVKIKKNRVKTTVVACTDDGSIYSDLCTLDGTNTKVPRI